MSTFEKLKAGIERLPGDELGELARWLSERQRERRDTQIKADSRAGRLDFLIDEARAEHSEGSLKKSSALLLGGREPPQNHTGLGRVPSAMARPPPGSSAARCQIHDTIRILVAAGLGRTTGSSTSSIPALRRPTEAGCGGSFTEHSTQPPSGSRSTPIQAVDVTRGTAAQARI